jgi:ribosomal protein S27AE
MGRGADVLRLIVLLVIAAIALYWLDRQVRRALRSPLGRLLRSLLGEPTAPLQPPQPRTDRATQQPLARCGTCGDYVPRAEVDDRQRCRRCHLIRTAG